ncbi:MAG: hypothetical protein WCD80_00775 [Desulfobaccales bacterium]
MTQTDLALEWEKLCEEHDAAMDAYFKKSATVTPKMASIAKGTSRDNPTYDEESEFDNAMEALIDVQRRMAEFMKKHCRN